MKPSERLKRLAAMQSIDIDEEEITVEGAITVIAAVWGCTPQQAADELLRMWRDGELEINARPVKKETLQ